MTPMERFKNDYEEHRGQEKLLLQPKLANKMDKLITLQVKFYKILPARSMRGNLIYFADFHDFLNGTLSTFNTNMFGDKPPREENSGATDSEKAAYEDGARFIYSMNIFVQLYYIEKYYMNNLPKAIEVEYIAIRPQLLDIFKSFTKTMIWVFAHSSYDPKYSTFTTFGQKELSKAKQINVLDKPVSK